MVRQTVDVKELRELTASRMSVALMLVKANMFQNPLQYFYREM
jgi:hypothetical protein